MLKGVDLSEWNDNSTIAEMKNAGQQYAILRGAGTYRGKQASVSIGYMYKDAHFNAFYDQAKRLNFPIGVYYYSTAGTSADGRAERQYLYDNCLKGRKFEYPVYIDVEESTCTTDGVIAFCEALEDMGYFVGVYANYNYFVNRLNNSKLDVYSRWLAFWQSSKPNVSFRFDMWQYGSTTINGKKIDGDICYADFPDIIIKGGFNGYEKQEPEPEPEPEPSITIKAGDLLRVLSIDDNSITLKKEGTEK